MSIRSSSVVLLAIALLAITYAGTTAAPPTAHSHAGMTSGREKCVARIGPSFVQFSVYQAREPRARYCMEIPDVGPATIVIDQGDAQLRDMMTDVRIVRDIGGGAELSSDAVVAPEALDVVTEKHLLPAIYPTGIIELVHRFTSPGRYHMLVTVKNEHGQIYVSDFPFQVGQSGRGALLLWGGIATAFIGAALWFAWKSGVLQRAWSRIGRV